MKSKFHDIIPNDKRSIRNVPIPARSVSHIEAKKLKQFENEENATYIDAIDDVAELKGQGINHATKTEHLTIHHGTHGHAHTHAHTHKHSEQHSHTNGSHSRSKKHKSVDGIESINIEPAFYQANEDIVTENLKDFDSTDSDKKRGKTFWLVTLALIIAVIYGFGTYFASATINIKLVEQTFDLKDTKIDLQDIKHDAIQQSFTKAVTVKVTGTKKVEEKATGTVILYNNFSSSAQTLAINTRLEIPEGLIYRTVKEVSIPGMKTVSGKKVAGSVEVGVVADKAGDTYNKGMKDFAVVAYKGSDRYKTIYGRSKTALKGGYLGMVADISDTDMALAIKDAKKLINEAVNAGYSALASKKEVPYTYISNAYLVDYSEPKQTISKDGKSADIELTAKVMAIIFNTDSLSQYLANTFVTKTSTASASTTNPSLDTPANSLAEKTDSGDSTVISKKYIATFDQINMKISSDTNVTMLNTNEGSVVFSGKTSISSILDEDVLKRAVSGLSIEQATGIIKNMVDFSTLSIKAFPFWLKTMPKIDSIKIQLLS